MSAALTDPLRLVVFDVDGTLIDSQRHIHASMTRAYEAAGLPAPLLSDVLRIVGLSLPEALARLLPDATETLRASVVEGYKASFAQERAQSLAPLYPGALEAIATLGARADTRLGVATGKSRRGLTHVLAAYGLDDVFVTTQVADDHPSKPHPAMLFAALRETGVAAGDAVMVGDTVYDIEMGRAAGLRTIGVTWGYHAAGALRDAGADRLIGAFEELPAAIDELWGLVA